MGDSEDDKARGGGGDSTTSLKQNVAGLLCYVGMWVTGIIFLIIEKENKEVRFHAMQSLVTFGILQIILGIASAVRGAAWAWTYAGGFGPSYAQWIAGSVIFYLFFAVMWILYIVLLVRTYHDQIFKVPLFGGFAESMLAKLDAGK